MSSQGDAGLAKFTCMVESVDESTFTASVRDLCNPDNPLELAEFEIAQVASDTRHFLLPGALFEWTCTPSSSVFHFYEAPVETEEQKVARVSSEADLCEFLGLQ